MRYLIIGLGIYGSNLARDLINLGHEVIGADFDEHVVEALKDDLTTVYHVDTTEAPALMALPFKNVDLVIVCIGENFGASVKTVALLKQYGVEHIYARAIDPLHHAILDCFNLDRILIPEQRAAADLAREMMLGRDVTTMRVSDDTFVAKFVVPSFFVGKSYSDVAGDTDGVTLIAATRPFEHTGLLHVVSRAPRLLDLTLKTLTVESGDIITVLATASSLKSMLSKHS